MLDDGLLERPGVRHGAASPKAETPDLRPETRDARARGYDQSPTPKGLWESGCRVSDPGASPRLPPKSWIRNPTPGPPALSVWSSGPPLQPEHEILDAGH